MRAKFPWAPRVVCLRVLVLGVVLVVVGGTLSYLHNSCVLPLLLRHCQLSSVCCRIPRTIVVEHVGGEFDPVRMDLVHVEIRFALTPSFLRL